MSTTLQHKMKLSYNNPMKLLGLRTLIYPSDNLQADKAWWSDVLGACRVIDKT